MDDRIFDFLMLLVKARELEAITPSQAQEITALSLNPVMIVETKK